MKKWYIFNCILVLALSASAQGNLQIRQANRSKGLVYNTEKAMVFEGKTNGFALGYQWGNLKTYYKTTFYRVDLGFLRHPKETRVSPTGVTIPTNSFFYGKENSFWQLRGGWGEKRYFSEKDNQASRGVAVGMSYSLGPTLGLIKPYYLNLTRNEINSVRLPENYIKYSAQTAADFLNKEKINGAAPFFTGLRETTVTPGAHVNMGIHFDWGAYEDFVRSIEAGVAADFFFKKVPILVAKQENRLYFVNLYVHLQIGKRK